MRLPNDSDPGSLVVDFEPRGPVVVPMEYLTRRLDRGVHGALAHSYALTTHAAQGATFAAARGGGTEASDPKGVYVALTRSTHDLSFHVMAEAASDPAAHEHQKMPRLVEDTEVLTAFTRNMASDRDELLAQEIDPRAARVAALGAAHTLSELDRLATSSSPEAPLAALARRHREQAIWAQARLHPLADLVARLGARPPMGPARQPWDEAVGRTAVYRERYRPACVPDGAYVSWALGPIPAHPAHRRLPGGGHRPAAGRAGRPGPARPCRAGRRAGPAPGRACPTQ